MTENGKCGFKCPGDPPCSQWTGTGCALDSIDWEDAEWDDDEEDYSRDDEVSCLNCGPECPAWVGDGLCEIALAWEQTMHDQYMDLHSGQQPCPVCGAMLISYEIATDQLWIWPGGDWPYSPMVGLEIYAILAAPKGEIHRQADVVHIFVGDGELRRECLIILDPDCIEKDREFVRESQ
jgi:hypothetical protein